MNWTQQIEKYIAEGRTVSGGKGDKTLKAGEEQQLGFNQQFMSMLQQQFGQQSSVLSFLKDKLQNVIQNPQGYSPEAMTALRSGATEGTARSYAQAQQATNQAIAARGGSALPSGVNAQLAAQNANEAAAANASSQQQITLANEQQKQSNYWNAIGALSGNAQTFSPQSYAGAVNSGAGALGELGSAYNQSKQGGFWSAFKTSLGNSLGNVLGSGAQKGLSDQNVPGF